MDSRFPRWLRTIVNRLSFLAVPNLGGLLAGIAVVAFFANLMFPVPPGYFLFDPVLIFEGGEWWRLFTFPFMAGFSGPIGILFYCMYVYFVMQIIESHWGSGPLTVYMLFSYLCAVIGGFIFRARADLSNLIFENISLALGTLLPNLELSIYFILPIKAKWLAAFGGALLFVSFLQTPTLAGKGFLVFAFLPYFVFFGPLGVQVVRDKWRRHKNRKKFDDNMWR